MSSCHHFDEILEVNPRTLGCEECQNSAIGGPTSEDV
jgi:hypothetical protein